LTQNVSESTNFKTIETLKVQLTTATLHAITLQATTAACPI